MNLPYITHSGIFKPRCNAGLIQTSFTYQLDIDKLTNADEVLKKIITDNVLNVLFASKSPSGNGVKAMLLLKEFMFLRDLWNYKKNTLAYHQTTDILFGYFKKYYAVDIDRQMKAISQPYFLFHSPDLFINEKLAQWIQTPRIYILNCLGIGRRSQDLN